MVDGFRSFDRIHVELMPDTYKPNDQIVYDGMMLEIAQNPHFVVFIIFVYLLCWSNHAITYTSAALAELGVFVGLYGRSKLAMSRILTVVRFAERIDEEEKRVEDSVLEKIESIELQNVRFSYPERADFEVIKGVSLKVTSGMKAAFVGSSGCGKSTMLQLLGLIYDVEVNPDAENGGGGVKFNGKNARDLNIDKLKSKIAWVSQEPVLFSGTLRENILLGIDLEDAPECERLFNGEKSTNVGKSLQESKESSQKAALIDTAIFRALEQAQCAHIVNRLPDRLDTQISGSTALSGGEKQRLAIARALIRKPEVLILDEATSALDYESEKQVQTALDAIISDSNMIVFTVAHRLSTIRHSDVIFVMNFGRLEESGKHEELIERKGMYWGLVNAASSSAAEDENEDENTDTENSVKNVQIQITDQNSVSSPESRKTSPGARSSKMSQSVRRSEKMRATLTASLTASKRRANFSAQHSSSSASSTIFSDHILGDSILDEMNLIGNGASFVGYTSIPSNTDLNYQRKDSTMTRTSYQSIKSRQKIDEHEDTNLFIDTFSPCSTIHEHKQASHNIVEGKVL